jgi:hypothetical protein
MFLIRIIVFLIFSLAANHYSVAQLAPRVTIFGNSSSNIIRSMAVYQDSIIFLYGYSYSDGLSRYESALHRMDNQGNVQWTKKYSHDFNRYGNSINITLDNKLIVCGEIYNTATGNDIFYAKLDTGGNVIWEKYISSMLNETANYIEPAADSSFVMCGLISDQFSSNDIYVARVDKYGDLFWEHTTGDIKNDYASMVVALPDSSFVVTADTQNPVDNDYDVRIIRFDKAGNVLWDKVYGDGLQNGCQGIYYTSDGYLVSYGETNIYRNSPFNYFLRKIDLQGNSIWYNTYGGSGPEAAFYLTESSNGDYIVTGYQGKNDLPIDVLISRISPEGELLFEDSFGGGSIDLGYSVRSIKDEFVFAGFSFDQGEKNYVLFIPESALTNVDRKALEENIKVFPNPANDFIHIIASEDNIRWEFLNLSGQIILSGQANGGQVRKDISFLQTGIYILRVFTAKQVHNIKVIKN